MNLSNITWTSELVAEWLQNAAQVDRILPRVGPHMARPRLIITRDLISKLWDKMDTDAPTPIFKPTNIQVSMWEEVVLRWFVLVDSDTDKKILWLRACGMSFRRISIKLGTERHALSKNHKNALEKLTRRLNKYYS